MEEKTGSQNISDLRVLTGELLLSDQFDIVKPLDNASIKVSVEEGAATIWSIYREPGMAVIAFYFAERGTRLRRQVRSETWTFVVLSGAMVVDSGQKGESLYRRREAFQAVSGQQYSLSWIEDTRMVLVAIPDIQELVSISDTEPSE